MAMLNYYMEIKDKFLKGHLKRKMGVLLEEKAKTLGISVRTWERLKKGLSERNDAA